LCNHQGEQGVRSNIEAYSKEDIGGALIELAREPTAGDMELEQTMAGRQCHPLDFRRVPGGHDQAP
jgi:hypothetical protein